MLPSGWTAGSRGRPSLPHGTSNCFTGMVTGAWRGERKRQQDGGGQGDECTHDGCSGGGLGPDIIVGVGTRVNRRQQGGCGMRSRRATIGAASSGRDGRRDQRSVNGASGFMGPQGPQRYPARSLPEVPLAPIARIPMVAAWSVIAAASPSPAAAQRQRFNRDPVEVEEHNAPYDGRFTFARLKYTTGPGGYYYRGLRPGPTAIRSPSTTWGRSWPP